MAYIIPDIDFQDEKIIAILLAAFIAFVAWLAKSFVEKPFNDSRETFFSFAEKRIQILSLIKTHLVFISLFPKDLKTKEKLQEILLKDGSTGFLNKETLNTSIEISINKDVNEKKILSTIADIDAELTLQIGKIQKENLLYIKYASTNPFKKVLGYIFMLIKSILWLTAAGLILFLTMRFILGLSSIWIIIVVGFILILIWLIEKYFLHWF